MSRLFDVSNQVDSDDWYTPAWIFDGLGLMFDLDVAAPDDPVPWIPARDRYTVGDDGLLQPWHGVVWCNPPYSDPAPWCRRWADHPDGLLLIRQDLSTTAGQSALAAASTVYVPKGRVDFHRPGRARRQSGASFSTLILARGSICDVALSRLAATYGGISRRLTPPR